MGTLSPHDVCPLPAFELERFFAKHEFSAPFLACCSDCQPLSLAHLLEYADEDGKARFHNLDLGYTETQGLPALRKAIVMQYHGPSIQPDDITVCAPEEGVYLAMRALLRPGDRVVCTFPGYQSLYSIAESIGCTVSKWEPVVGSATSPAAQFLVDSLEDLVKAAPTRLVVVNFPHNPTGALLSQKDWNRVVDVCRVNGCYLFSDEMYRFLELYPGARLPSAADQYERGISLNGCSKALALPGLRIGWLTCRDTGLKEQILTLKDYTTICVAAPSEVLALIAVRAAPRIIERNLELIRSNTQAVEQFVGQWPHALEWAPPVAGPVAFPRFKKKFLTTLVASQQDQADTSEVEIIAEKLVAHSGVLILPASVYGHGPSTQAGNFRLGLGRRNFQECLDKLGCYLAVCACSNTEGSHSSD